MDRYRTSIHSVSPINNSYMTEGHVKSNLESRIEYENSQVSLISLIKVLAIISTLILLLIATKFALDARFRSEECGKKHTFGQYIARLQYRLFGGVNPDSCEKKIDKVEGEIDGGKVEVITKTTTCKRTGKDDSEESKGIWQYFSLPFFGCEDYKAHEAALKNQKFSVKEGIQTPPSLLEVTKTEKIDEPLSNISNFAEITEENSREIKNKFDALIGDYVLQIRETTAHTLPIDNLDIEDSKQIQKSKKLLEKPTVFDLQLKINDLVHSSKNLSRKKQNLLNFQERFFAVTKTPNSCANEISELRRKLDIENEKLNHSISMRRTWENDLKKLQESIDNKRNENKNSGPLGQIDRLNKEIEELRKKKADAERFLTEINNRRKQITTFELEINNLNNVISTSTNSLNDLDDQIAALRRELDSLNHQIKINDNKKILWEMKLELAKRNKHIKEFLLTLIDTKEGKTNDLQALFADKISSEKELKAIVKAFINQSRASKNEVIMSDEQIDSLIKQDEKDFNEITRLYTELVKVINEYKDIDFDISLMTSSITELGNKNAQVLLEIRSVNTRIHDLENLKKSKLADIDHNRGKIREIEEKIVKNNQYIYKNTINVHDIDRDIASKTKEYNDLKEQWDVT